MSQPIEVYIDKLILHGFPARDRYRIAIAIETELARLFTEHGIPSVLTTGGEIPVLQAGDFRLRPGAKASVVGNHIAGSLYKGFTNGEQSTRKNGK